MDALRPDPLGEALVYRAVNDTPDLLGAAFGETLDTAAHDSAAAVLYRVALAFCDSDDAEAWVRDRLTAAGVAQSPAVVGAFMRQIPLETVAFKALMADWARSRVTLTKQWVEADPEDEAALSTYAAAIGEYGNRLYSLGRHEEAVVATEESVEVYRRLVARSADAHEPGLAKSLSNIGSMLIWFDRRREAQAALEEAVGVYRRLAARYVDVYGPDLARSLGALGNAQRTENASAAVASLAEGIRHLTSHFLRLPAAHGGLLSTLLQWYLQASESANQEPDAELLEPLLPYLTPPQEGK